MAIKKYKRSLETRKKLSLSKMGNKNPRYGIIPSAEDREKNRLGQLRRKERDGYINSF